MRAFLLWAALRHHWLHYWYGELDACDCGLWLCKHWPDGGPPDEGIRVMIFPGFWTRL